MPLRQAIPGLSRQITVTLPSNNHSSRSHIGRAQTAAKPLVSCAIHVRHRQECNRGVTVFGIPTKNMVECNPQKSRGHLHGTDGWMHRVVRSEDSHAALMTLRAFCISRPILGHGTRNYEYIRRVLCRTDTNRWVDAWICSYVSVLSVGRILSMGMKTVSYLYLG